jgi:hypothetical protein
MKLLYGYIPEFHYENSWLLGGVNIRFEMVLYLYKFIMNFRRGIMTTDLLITITETGEQTKISNFEGKLFMKEDAIDFINYLSDKYGMTGFKITNL